MGGRLWAPFFFAACPDLTDMVRCSAQRTANLAEPGLGQQAMSIALIVLAGATAPTAVTLEEAQAMSPSMLAERLLPDTEHGPMVDAIVNGRGLLPPSQGVHRVWLVERMVPYDAKVCRSHVFNIEMGSSAPGASPWTSALPTHPIKVEQYDRLWMPPSGAASADTCAAAPPQESGFGHGGLGLERAAKLAVEARETFARSASRRRLRVSCKGERGVCGVDALTTLAKIDWSMLGTIAQVSPDSEPYHDGEAKPADADWGPSNVQFTFPYAAQGATWIITTTRRPKITQVKMEAIHIIYH